MNTPANTRSSRRGLHARAAALPLRMRLVAGFAGAIIVVLSAAGTFVYWRVSYALDARLNNDARDAVATLSPLVTPAGTLRTDPNIVGSSAGRQYQVVDLDGHVLSYGPEAGAAALLPPTTVRQALDGPVTVNLGAFLPRSDRPLRVLVVRLGGTEPARFLIVAIRRDQRDEALRELLAQLTVAGLGTLVVTAVVGERLAKAALVPVERYRQQAARIARGATGVRLDVPAERDDEVTRLGQMLNTMLDALEETVERERRFTQDASHELRTPLTLLSTRVQLALRRPRSNEALQATLAELGRDIDGLSQLADDLLSLTAASRNDRAEQSLSLADLNDLIEVVAGDHTGVQLEVLDLKGSPARSTVPLGEQQVRQVLSNLLANAVNHGIPPVYLGATLLGNARYARITVTDSGLGMQAAFLPQAVERFARADDARDRPGAGLGLALVHALLEPVGGELRLCVDGAHQRYSQRISVLCQHPHAGTVATVLMPVRNSLPPLT